MIPDKHSFCNKIEVFKTNVYELHQSKNILSEIKKKYPDLKVNFDLEDIDNILRVEGNFEVDEIMFFLNEFGVIIEILPD